MKKFITNKGYTLIEVLISITLLSLIITGSIYIFQTAFYHTVKSQAQTSAQTIARNALMFMQNQNFIMMRDYFETSGEKNKDEEGIYFQLCDNKYTITYAESTSPNDQNLKVCNNISVDQINYDVKVVAAEPITSDKEFYSFYIPIRVIVSWNLNGVQTVELKGDIKSEDIR